MKARDIRGGDGIRYSSDRILRPTAEHPKRRLCGSIAAIARSPYGMLRGAFISGERGGFEQRYHHLVVRRGNPMFPAETHDGAVTRIHLHRPSRRAIGVQRVH